MCTRFIIKTKSLLTRELLPLLRFPVPRNVVSRSFLHSFFCHLFFLLISSFSFPQRLQCLYSTSLLQVSAWALGFLSLFNKWQIYLYMSERDTLSVPSETGCISLVHPLPASTSSNPNVCFRKPRFLDPFQPPSQGCCWRSFTFYDEYAVLPQFLSLPFYSPWSDQSNNFQSVEFSYINLSLKCFLVDSGLVSGFLKWPRSFPGLPVAHFKVAKFVSGWVFLSSSWIPIFLTFLLTVEIYRGSRSLSQTRCS